MLSVGVEGEGQRAERSPAPVCREKWKPFQMPIYKRPTAAALDPGPRFPVPGTWNLDLLPDPQMMTGLWLIFPSLDEEKKS